MKKFLLAVFGASLLFGMLNVNATPEGDRKKLLELYKNQFPNIKFDDYVNGAFIFSQNSFEQYLSIMDFPPFESTIEEGKKMWETPFKNGKKYADCFPNGGKNIAGNYPYFDNNLNKVATFEMAMNSCRKANGEDEYPYTNMQVMPNHLGVLTAYARTLSDGMRVNIRVEGPKALEAYEKGKVFFTQRRGQLNFACVQCHIPSVSKVLRTEVLSPVVGQTTHWPVFRGGDVLWTLHQRYQLCNSQIRATPFNIGSEEFNNLEYFHSYMSNGLPMQASVFRK